MKRRQFLAAAIGAAAWPSLARAQAFPSRAITMIVPFAAGGPTDALGRILAESMRKTVGQAVIIENVTGASGGIAGLKAARSAPDGYTITIGQWGTHCLNGAISTLQYDLLKDFEPIALIANGPQLIIARTSLPARDLKEMVAWLKDNPGKATVGTAGVGTGAHVAAVFFQKQTGVDFRFVPYRGAGPGLNDLIAGQIDIMFDQASNSIQQVRGGTVKAFAVTSRKRMPSAPDIPTVDEAGMPNLHIDFWHGVWAPKATPANIVATLNAAIVAALADDDVRRRFADLAQDVPAPDLQTPAGLRAHQTAEIEKWWPIVKAAGIRIE